MRILAAIGQDSDPNSWKVIVAGTGDDDRRGGGDDRLGLGAQLPIV